MGKECLLKIISSYENTSRRKEHRGTKNLKTDKFKRKSILKRRELKKREKVEQA